MSESEYSVEETETDEGKLARRWITDLQSSERWQEDYLALCGRIIRRYRNNRLQTEGGDQNAVTLGSVKRFAILWSNMQILQPAVYARTPEPVVSRRYKDSDPVGRYASEVLERALSFTVDQYDFDDVMRLVTADYLLLARSTAWVRYVPHMATPDVQPMTEGEEIEEDGPSVTDSAQALEQPVHAEALFDHVNYADWGMQPCRSWDETCYVWRRVFMTREELIERFGREIGSKVPLDWSPRDNRFVSDEIRSRIKRAAVYEIWDKDTGKVYWVNKAFPESVLDERDDWLSLDGFFPCPRPLMGTLSPDTYIPVPDYVYYQDQAEELDELTARIGLLTNALRMVGIYAGEERQMLSNVFSGNQNQLIPVSNMASLQDKGGMRGLIEWLPIDMVIKTLEGCFLARKQIMEDIYQITGISDIVRGATDPNETATAQGIKQQWGSLRVRDRQKEVARFARDLLRIAAEIIAKKFPIQTLRAMTDVKLMTEAEKQQAQMQMQAIASLNQQRQQMGAPPIPDPMTPEQQRMLKAPSWDVVNGLLKNDALRTFRVDVETDSTIEPNETEDKQRAVEFVTAIGGLIGQSTAAVQAAPQLAPVVAESIKFLVRRYRVGREMEDIIETTFDRIANMTPQQDQAAPAGPTQEEMQLQAAEIQTRAQEAARKDQLEQQRLQLDGQLGMADIQLRARDQQIKVDTLARDPRPQGIV